MPSAKCSTVPGSRSSAMSAIASKATREVMLWYSAWTTSGAPLPARTAVSSLVTAASPASCLLTSTCTSGFCWFQRATTSSMPGAQVQKVSSTGAEEDAEPQPARAPPASPAAPRPAPDCSSRRRDGRQLGRGGVALVMLASLRWTARSGPSGEAEIVEL